MNTQDRARVQQALEALEYHSEQTHRIWKTELAKAALRQLLKQPNTPDYAWPTVQDYEREMGFEVNDTFKGAWAMARTTNGMLLQMAGPDEGESNE